MSRSPIHNLHQNLGATFDMISEWEMPQHYGKVGEEYQAVRGSVGLIDCSHWGKVVLSGQDRAKFLHNVTSNEIVSLKEGEGSYNTILTPKGRMLSSFWVHVFKDSLLLVLDHLQVKQLLELLDKYTFVSEVKMEDSTPDWGVLLLAGPSAASVANAVLGQAPKPLQPGHFFIADVCGEKTLFVNTPTTGGPEFTIYVRSEGLKALWEHFMEKGASFGIRPVGQEVVKVLRIEAGFPLYGVDMDDFIIPIEAGLDERAISYTKGCYVGQEVIARIKTYGHVNKHLVGFILQGEALPLHGSKIFDQQEKEVGWITSVVRSPGLDKVIALGYLRTQVSSPGTELVVASGEERIPATVSALPFSADYK